jgi:hypothetical protein
MDILVSDSSTRLTGVQTGISGEYFVAAELTRRGYVASITLRNTAGIDILAANLTGSKSVSIQVKTRQGLRPVWTLGVKNETQRSDNLFYVLVILKPAEQGMLPEFYVVPSAVVANTITRSHRKWLRTPGKGGCKHNDNPMRKFWDNEGKYKNRWDLLGLD